MLKKLILAAVPMMFLVSVSVAEDDFLADLDINSIQDAEISIEEAGFDVDFDKLDDEASQEEAIEACFRSYGYRSYGYGYSYSYYRPYYSCYRPVYYHTYYRPVVYRTYYPVYRNYWGCW